MNKNIFDFRANNSELKTKRINKKKIIILIFILIILLTIIGLLIAYSVNENFRNFWDYSVLRKEVESSDVKSIIFEKGHEYNANSYNKKLVILEDNILKLYNAEGVEELELGINITSPLYSSNNRFLVIAENAGNKIYLLNENNIVWQKDLEGQISKVYVNKNGYTAIAMTSLGYKTIIVLYTPAGEELFKTYLPTTYCLDMEISNDNKYVAIAEASSSGTMIETSIKIISVENAREKPQEAFIATYNANSNNMILNLKYTDTGNLIAMYDNGIFYANENMDKIVDIEDNTMFADIEGNNKIITIEKKSSSILNLAYIIKIYDVTSQKTIEYNLKELPKELYVKEDIIAVNYGTDVEIISATTGWLIKKYVSRQEIKEVLISNNFVAVEYNETIKIIKI